MKDTLVCSYQVNIWTLQLTTLQVAVHFTKQLRAFSKNNQDKCSGNHPPQKRSGSKVPHLREFEHEAYLSKDSLGYDAVKVTPNFCIVTQNNTNLLLVHPHSVTRQDHYHFRLNQSCGPTVPASASTGHRKKRQLKSQVSTIKCYSLEVTHTFPLKLPWPKKSHGCAFHEGAGK